MFEMAAVSATVLVDNSQTRGRSMMRSVTIAEPIALPAARSAQVAQLVVNTEGSFELMTTAASSSRKSRHCWGSYAEPANIRAVAPPDGLRMTPAWLPWTPSARAEAMTVAANVTAGSQHGSGYLLHPAVADATLHLSAAAAQTSSPQRTRVPTGLTALSVPARAPQGRLTPLATPAPAAADGSIMGSYLLASAAAGAVLQLDGLVIKEMPVSVPARPAAAVEAAAADRTPAAATDILYETVWQASEAARVHRSLPSAAAQQSQSTLHPRAVRQDGSVPLDHTELSAAQLAVSADGQLHIDVGTMLRQDPGDAQGLASTVATATMHGIELLRRYLPNSGARAGLHLGTCGASSANGTSAGHPSSSATHAVACAALAALMRVAATENPGLTVRGLDTDLTAFGTAERGETQVRQNSCAAFLDVGMSIDDRR